ncbi:MAG: S8 family peptidase, partial [Bacteroidota bacterium]
EAQKGLLVSVHPYGSNLGWGGSHDGPNGRLPVWNGTPSVHPSEDYQFGQYSIVTQMADEIHVRNPYVQMVKSVGNDRDDAKDGTAGHYVFDPLQYKFVYSEAPRSPDGGPGGFDTIIGDASTGKNVLTIGACVAVPGAYQSASDVQVHPYSGFGPTDDGRLGVDLVAPSDVADRLITGRSDADYTSGSTGTSYAAPVVGGAIALLQELHASLRPAAAPLQSSTIRALLFGSAFDAELAGPDYRSGWGQVNVEGAANLLSLDAIDETTIQVVETSPSETVRFDVVAGAGPLTVQIAWTDPAAAPSFNTHNDRTVRLVHDVDVRVLGPDGTHQPWVLDPTQPAQPATRGDNVLDNAEQVFIAQPIPGATYTVEISQKSGAAQQVSVVVAGNQIANVDQDLEGDGLQIQFEDVDQDGSFLNDDTDGDGIPNYRDADDDGDGIPTAQECADPNGDGNPADACMLQGVPRYLSAASLPVELAEVSVSAEGLRIRIDWLTATETDNAGFAIDLRPAVCNENCAWRDLGFVEGAGTSDIAHSYTFATGELAPGLYRIRLRQVDFDGAMTEHPALDIEIASPSAIFVSDAYPNPTSRASRLSLRLGVEEEGQVRVYNALGQLVDQVFDGRWTAGTTYTYETTLSQSMPAGAYFIVIQGESFTETRQFTLVR